MEPFRALVGGHARPRPAAPRLLDQAVLWGNLGVSLLVLVAGRSWSGLGLWPALAATVVGAVVGNALLGLAAVPAAATGVPAMVLFRARSGSAARCSPPPATSSRTSAGPPSSCS